MQVEFTNENSGIFMTGASGYLGSHLLRRLVEHGRTVHCLKRACSNLWRVEDIAAKVHWVDLEVVDFHAFFSDHQIACVLHCATDYGRKQVDPAQIIEANLILPLKLLHAAATHGVATFINTDTILDKGVNNYSLSKNQFVDWLKAYSDRIVGINMVLEHFYGPGDDPSKFVTFIVRSLLSGEGRLELTPGEQKRDFIYIDDVVDAFMTLMDRISSLPIRFNRFEVGSGQAVKIRRFVELVKQLSGNDTTILDFGAVPYRKNEVMESDVDISGLTSFGWKPVVALQDGLQRTIQNEKQERKKEA